MLSAIVAIALGVVLSLAYAGIGMALAPEKTHG